MKILTYLPLPKPLTFWSGVGSALVAGVASAFGGSSSNKANANLDTKNRKFQSFEAEKNRQFQRNMSSSAVRRHMTDMKLAGLNPILAAGGSASTPAGSAPSGNRTPQQDEITPAINTALATRRQNQEIKNMRATEKLTRTQEDNVQKDTIKKAEESMNLRKEWEIMNSTAKERAAEEALYKGDKGKWLKLFEKIFGSSGSSTAMKLLSKGKN